MSKLFNLFSSSNNKSGRGVTKKQVERDKKMGVGFFFRLLKARLGNISSTSLIFSVCNFPILLFLFGISGNLDSSVPGPISPLYAQVYGMEVAAVKGTELAAKQGPLLSTLHGIFGVNTSVSVVSLGSKIFMYCAALLILTFGLASIGAIYNMRSVARCEPLSPWSEFFPAVRRNFKQGILIAVMDALLILFLGYDLIAYYANANQFFMQMSFYVVLFFTIIYYVMRFHMYLILVTFDLKTSKLLKNAVLLTFLGWKRSLLCLIASVLTVLISVYLYVLLPFFGLLLPFVFTFGILTFIGVYAAYPVIDKYMIEPYYLEHPEERPEEEEIEPVFTDRG